MYELALAAAQFSRSSGISRGDIAAHYEQLTGKNAAEAPRTVLHRDSSGKMVALSTSPAEELSRMRSISVPTTAHLSGNGMFTVVLTKEKVESVTFVSGDSKVENVGKALSSAKFNMDFPDNGPEKIVRRGFLSCYTTCDYVVLNTGDINLMQPMQVPSVLQ
jgi:hypothetical protein